jgi:Lipocalin-like domain
MKIVKHLSLLAFVAITTFACKKDEAVVDNTTLITTGKWKQISETTAGVDTYASFLACEKDNTLAFATTGTATFDEGATKCDPADAQTETATWAFSGTDKKTVVLTQGGFGITFTINELTTTSLKWQYTNPFDNKIVVAGFSK